MMAERGRSHGHQILIANATNIISVQRPQRLSLSGCRDEFGVQPIGPIELDDRSKVTPAKPAPGNGVMQNHRFQLSELQCAVEPSPPSR